MRWLSYECGNGHEASVRGARPCLPDLGKSGLPVSAQLLLLPGDVVCHPRFFGTGAPTHGEYLEAVLD